MTLSPDSAGDNRREDNSDWEEALGLITEEWIPEWEEYRDAGL